MARQHQYRVTFYDQQGNCHQVELSTVYQIRRDPQCDLCLFDTQHCVGSEEMLERMIRQKTGLEQEISIINARLI
ncbi:Uncharacterised protein [Aeromonas encheleia]|jgi:hypothetical protein|uniref:Uncharacterized protein n=1 Tax=Aeromonas encheleia TaxID=73010 RepID=A0AAE9MEJ1_9GAMM|nr:MULTISPECIES: hypothetical protein [Aeromonas]MBV7413472.1 hypothetical protein [Aeromonas sp. sif2433]MBV7436012.1 hypothetical protein [Aeromonas sp. sif2416]MBV7596681.1 hypothetical protein [Aeromonas sp. sia0103]UNP87439.1 hypothetical protein MNZ22_11315 [Aeromonas encheleia]USV56296.1 hypothetical protein NHF51_13125 [Aeromonas encheleia]